MTVGNRSVSIVYRLFLFVLLFITGLTVIGCSRVSREASQQPLQIELIEPLFPPGVGKYTMNVRLFDEYDNPVDDAQIAIKADMTHAGMVPILANATHGDKGLYKVPFEWTMGGDWVVVIQATLPDGSVTEETFPIIISGDPADCGVEATEIP
jgi:hypothetical protein